MSGVFSSEVSLSMGTGPGHAAIIRAAGLALLVSPAGALLPLHASVRLAAPLRAPLRSAVPPRAPEAWLAADGNLQQQPPSGNPLQRIIRRLRPKAPDGSAAPLPPWMRRGLVLLMRLRPLLPAFIIVAMLMGQAARRSAATPRPVELTYAMFMKLVATRASSLTDMKISLTRITFLLDGNPSFTRPVRAPSDVRRRNRRTEPERAPPPCVAPPCFGAWSN